MLKMRNKTWLWSCWVSYALMNPEFPNFQNWGKKSCIQSDASIMPKAKSDVSRQAYSRIQIPELIGLNLCKGHEVIIFTHSRVHSRPAFYSSLQDLWRKIESVLWNSSVFFRLCLCSIYELAVPLKMSLWSHDVIRYSFLPRKK